MTESKFYGLKSADEARKVKFGQVHVGKPEVISESTPITLSEHWQILMGQVENTLSETELNVEIAKESKLDEESQKSKAALAELMPQELIREYRSLSKIISDHYRDREEENEYALVEEREEKWIVLLLDHIKAKNESVTEQELDALEAQAWIFFQALESTIAIRSLEREVLQSRDGKEIFDKSEIERLTEKYDITAGELEILSEIVIPDSETGEYNLEKLTLTLNQLWREYSLGEQKKAFGKISLGYLLGRAANSYAPSLFEDFGSDNPWIFLQFMSLQVFSSAVETGVEIEMEKVMLELEQKINERIVNSLFYNEFEFIHDQSLGDLFSTLDLGKNATRELVQGVVSEFVPSLTGVAASLGFLTKVNPILGAIGASGIPVMYYVARQQNKKLEGAYEGEIDAGRTAASKLGAIKTGFVEAKASADVEVIAHDTLGSMNYLDAMKAKRVMAETKNRFIQMIPNHISAVVAAVVGGVMQQLGHIPPGAVVSNVLYTNMLSRPIERLTQLYFIEFARNVQDIDRMNKILGDYAELDTPEGEKEVERIPVSELSDLSIDIENISFRGILKDVSLSIAPGEFMVISGESGKGKSTLLRTISGLYKPDQGSVRVGGHAIDSIKKYGPTSLLSKMSYCNQQPQVFLDMSLRDNLLLWSEGTSDDKINEVLLKLRLDKFIGKLDQNKFQLSGGEKVRLGLARTLLKSPSIILLDEPTSSLDSTTAAEVRRIIVELHQSQPETTIICVTHDPELVALGDREYCM